MTIKFNLYDLGEKHLTYDLEDHWSCTTPQLERLVSDVLEQVALQIDGIASCSYAGQAPVTKAQAQALRDAAETLRCDFRDFDAATLYRMAADLERKA